MGIRKKGNLIKLVVLVLVVLTNGSVSSSKPLARQSLLLSYKVPDKISSQRALDIIDTLERFLVNCDDDYLECRIRYRTGVLYFKAGMEDEAVKRFLSVAHKEDCCAEIRVCSFNMAGQILQMSGDYSKALEVYDELIETAKRQREGSEPGAFSPAVEKLLLLSIFSRGRLYQMDGNYSAAISEYKRVSGLFKGKDFEGVDNYIALAEDMVSQLYLKQDDTAGYLKTAGDLIEAFPDYYRTAVIKLERECVRFLKENSYKISFPGGSFSAPARLIAYFREERGEGEKQEVAELLEGLCEQEQEGFGGFLLRYHYACLLDFLGDKERSIELFSQVCSLDTDEITDDESQRRICEIIRNYSKLQRVIIMGDMGDYNRCLELLSTLDIPPDDGHLTDLLKSIKKDIKTLKRENVK